MTKHIAWVAVIVAVLGCAHAGLIAQEVPLEHLTLPQGFRIDVYASGVENARQMTLSPSGTLFVGTRQAGNVYAVVDDNDDQRADKVLTIASGLQMPSGIAFRDGDLYVAEISRIVRFDEIESRLDAPPEAVVVNDSLPSEFLHGWKFIAFGPDGQLYVPVAAPCNVCDRTGEDPFRRDPADEPRRRG